MLLVSLAAIVLLVAFAGVLVVGAPYLPTLKPQINTALDLLDLKTGQTLLELGCGDGKVLIAAAQKGYCAVGIEINPFLALAAWLRTRRYGGRVKVIWGNYWRTPWPPADAVYVFLLDAFMPRLDTYMQRRKGKLVSVAFRIPSKQPLVERNGVFLYDYN
jgi:SAM-dependent methyltransferase